jgi:tetratricopeptide (TPR) repeat protein
MCCVSLIPLCIHSSVGVSYGAPPLYPEVYGESSALTSGDEQQISQELACNDADDTCKSASVGLKELISYNIDDGSLTINSEQTYTEPFNQYGMEAARHLRGIVKNVNSIELFASENDNLDNYIDFISYLTNDLSALGSIHKLDWLVGSDSSTLDTKLQQESFEKTLSVCKAVLEIFNLLRSRLESNDHDIALETREYVFTGIASAALVLGDLFHHMQSMDPSAGKTAYQYFTLAEGTIINSLSSMGIDGNGNRVAKEKSRQVDDVSLSILDIHASINLGFGTLLLDMYLLGFSFDLENNLQYGSSGFSTNHHATTSEGLGQQLSESQKHILEEAFAKLETYTKVHKKIQQFSDVDVSEYDLADAYSKMGIVKGLLHEWSLSAEICQRGFSMFEEFIRREFQNEGNAVAVDGFIVTLMSVTQSLFEAYLHLPGETESAKDAFRKHLLVSQAAETGALGSIFGKELINEDEEEVRNKDATQPFTDSLQVQESLKVYQNMLDETLRKQQENPTGMHYSELDIDGGAAYEVHDNLYEGSLRSVIGSLYHDMNELWKARDELEYASRLLGQGIELVESGKFEVLGDDGKPPSYPIRLDLAHVLLSLSYTYLALMQWKKSYDTFEDAMDIYQSELAEGDSPLVWNFETAESSNLSMADRFLKLFFLDPPVVDLEDFQQAGQNVSTE